MRELFVDNFAGGGGTSTGIEMAIGRSVDIAINHDPDAIAMHKANHPDSKHYCEDVWEVDPVKACEGNQVALAWFSPDCKHFSRAKGAKPLDNKIRGLAWVAIKWALLVRPRVIMIENVPEIQSWGPLGEDGKPIKERIGETFNGFLRIFSSGLSKEDPAFIECCNTLGVDINSQEADHLSNGLQYNLEFRELSSCDYGAPTSRRRFYLIARSDNKPIVFPEATHAPKDSSEVQSGKLLPYHTASECIDWTIPSKSIFERKKPLADKTLRRIAKGIKKFILDNPDPYILRRIQGQVAPIIIQYHSETTNCEVRAQDLREPLMTVDASPRYALSYAKLEKKGEVNEDENSHRIDVKAFLIKYFSTGTPKTIEEPLDTVTTKDRFALVEVFGDEYAISDIRMRMLQPRELFDAQGFPHNYIIDRDFKGNVYSKSKQVARCGNAVTPPVVTALIRANLPEYCA